MEDSDSNISGWWVCLFIVGMAVMVALLTVTDTLRRPTPAQVEADAADARALAIFHKQLKQLEEQAQAPGITADAKYQLEKRMAHVRDQLESKEEQRWNFD